MLRRQQILGDWLVSYVSKKKETFEPSRIVLTSRFVYLLKKSKKRHWKVKEVVHVRHVEFIKGIKNKERERECVCVFIIHLFRIFKIIKKLANDPNEGELILEDSSQIIRTDSATEILEIENKLNSVK